MKYGIVPFSLFFKTKNLGKKEFYSTNTKREKGAREAQDFEHFCETSVDIKCNDDTNYKEKQQLRLYVTEDKDNKRKKTRDGSFEQEQ